MAGGAAHWSLRAWAALPANHRCAVGLMPLPREQFRIGLLKLILHSELRRRAASRRALPCPSSFTRNCDPWATSSSLTVWVYLHSNFVVGSKRHECNATERIIAVQGHFRSSTVVDFGTNRKRVYDFLLVINSNIGPILHRFGDTVVYWSKNRQNRQFVPTPVSKIALARGDPYRIS